MFKKWQQGDGEKQRKCSAKIWGWDANAKDPVIPALHLEQEVWKGEVQEAYLLFITENLSLIRSCIAYHEDKQLHVPSLVQFSRWVSSDSLRPMDCSTPGFLISHQHPEPAQTHVHWVSDAIQPSHPLLLFRPLLLPSIFPSSRVFSSESVLHIRWPKHWSFSFSFSPSNEYSGLISFTIDWFDLPAVQRTLKNLL